MPMFKVTCKLHMDDEWDWFSVLAIVFTHRMRNDSSLVTLLLWPMCKELSSHLKGKVSQKYSRHLACECILSHQSCLTLCDPTDCSLPGSSVHEILQARILKWVVMLSSRRSSWPRYQTLVFCIAGRFFTIWATGMPVTIINLFNNY